MTKLLVIYKKINTNLGTSYFDRVTHKLFNNVAHINTHTLKKNKKSKIITFDKLYHKNLIHNIRLVQIAFYYYSNALIGWYIVTHTMGRDAIHTIIDRKKYKNNTIITYSGCTTDIHIQSPHIFNLNSIFLFCNIYIGIDEIYFFNPTNKRKIILMMNYWIVLFNLEKYIFHPFF